MSYELITGDIFDVAKQGVVVHQVNCVGVWGAGIALQMRRVYPLAYERYMSKYNGTGEFDGMGGWVLGNWQLTEVLPGLRVCNFAGQYSIGHGETSEIAYKHVMPLIFRHVEKMKYGKIYMPWMIGCGLGGGDWKHIRALIEECGDVTWVRLGPE